MASRELIDIPLFDTETSLAPCRRTLRLLWGASGRMQCGVLLRTLNAADVPFLSNRSVGWSAGQWEP